MSMKQRMKDWKCLNYTLNKIPKGFKDSRKSGMSM